MKTTINRQTVQGYFGQDIGYGNRWLFVKSSDGKRSYPIAQVSQTGDIIKFDPQQALRIGTNEEIAKALLAVA